MDNYWWLFPFDGQRNRKRQRNGENSFLRFQVTSDHCSGRESFHVLLLLRTHGRDLHEKSGSEKSDHREGKSCSSVGHDEREDAEEKKTLSEDDHSMEDEDVSAEDTRTATFYTRMYRVQREKDAVHRIQETS